MNVSRSILLGAFFVVPITRDVQLLEYRCLLRHPIQLEPSYCPQGFCNSEE
jgi:hypothetical protein